MVTTTSGRLAISRHRRISSDGSYGLDTTVAVEINGTSQRVRLCGARRGLPPVLIVQAGPGLPLLNECTKFQQRLQLEQDFSVAYWEQRGCGPASLRDARDVSLETQIDDCRAMVRWLAEETRQPVVVLGISLGATIALQAVAREASAVKALVAVSIDTDTATSDAAAHAFLQAASTQPDQRRIATRLEKLGPPPYTTPGPLQSRARMLTDLGGMEHGRRFGELARSLLLSLIRTYGVLGAAATLRNMNAIQRRLLPDLVTLNLFAQWPRSAIPVHYIFGDRDPLNPGSIVERVSEVITDQDTVVTVPDAGHMAHFDQPATVRSIVAQASSRP
jgi:pimeloyl-ACP methyl ester carboxylesterase